MFHKIKKRDISGLQLPYLGFKYDDIPFLCYQNFIILCCNVYDKEQTKDHLNEWINTKNLSPLYRPT